MREEKSPVLFHGQALKCPVPSGNKQVIKVYPEHGRTAANVSTGTISPVSIST